MENSVEYDRIHLITCNDWSASEIEDFPDNIPAPMSVDGTSPYQMGIYSKNRRNYYTTGYVGVGRIFDENNQVKKIDCEDGIQRELVLRVNPRFDVDPWDMLSTIMGDEEYMSYVENDPDRFFSIYANEPTIKMPSNQNGGELLLVMSFIRMCDSLCKKGLRANMNFEENNYSGKLKGKILFNKHFKNNVIKGRYDKIYCRHTSFSVDTKENRIIKAALKVAKSMLSKNKIKLGPFFDMLARCEDEFLSVSDITICKSDFCNLKLNGFNSRYASIINLAKLLLTKTSINILGSDIEETSEIIPYVIKMEPLFEFYIRTIVKKFIDDNNLDLEVVGYKQKYNILDNSELYLMNNYMPDLAIKSNDGRFAAVFDAKYQPINIKNSSDPRKRHNTHQLLFYALMLNSCKCGFIFPKMQDDFSDDGEIQDSRINIQDGNLNIIKDAYYSQWVLCGSKDKDKKAIEKIIDWICK